MNIRIPEILDHSHFEAALQSAREADAAHRAEEKVRLETIASLRKQMTDLAKQIRALGGYAEVDFCADWYEAEWEHVEVFSNEDTVRFDGEYIEDEWNDFCDEQEPATYVKDNWKYGKRPVVSFKSHKAHTCRYGHILVTGKDKTRTERAKMLSKHKQTKKRAALERRL